MSILNGIQDFFKEERLTLDQEQLLDQLQANRAKAVYLIPENLWKEFLKSVLSDERLNRIVVQATASPEGAGIYRREYVCGHINVCLSVRDFAAKLVANNVDPQAVARAMLENIGG